MTREEQIKKQADIYTDDASNYANWSDDGGWSETNDIELIEKAFMEGAKWADKTMVEIVLKFIFDHFYDHPHVNGHICTDSFPSLEALEEELIEVMEE